MTADSLSPSPRWPWALTLGAVAALVAFEGWVLLRLGTVADAGLLANAITVDLVVGLPLVVWFGLVRTRRAAPFVLVPATVGAILLAHALVPAQHGSLIRFLAQALPVLELGILGYAGYRFIRLARRGWTVHQDQGDPLDAWEAELAKMTGSPRAAGLIVSELAAFVFSIVGWRAKAPVAAPGVQTFGLHKRGGFHALLGVMLGVSVFEVVGVHVLLSMWSDTAAWIVTALTIYSIIWVIGDFQAMRLRPTTLSGDRLDLRCGLRWRGVIRRGQVLALHDGTVTPPEKAEAGGKPLNAYGLGAADAWLELHEPQRFDGPYGVRRTTRWVGLGANDAEALRAALRDWVDGDDSTAG